MSVNLGVAVVAGYCIVGLTFALANYLAISHTGKANLPTEESAWWVLVLIVVMWPLPMRAFVREHVRSVSYDYIVGMAVTQDEGGYWLISRKGKIIPFGNAYNWKFSSGFRSTRVQRNVSNFFVWPDGHIFRGEGVPELDDRFEGEFKLPVVDAKVNNAQDGYWLVDAGGKVYSVGAAPHFGDISHDPGTYGISLEPPQNIYDAIYLRWDDVATLAKLPQA